MSASRSLTRLGLFSLVGLAAAVALAGCWPEETPEPVAPDPVQVDDATADADDGAGQADADDQAADATETTASGSGDATPEVSWGSGTGLSSGGADTEATTGSKTTASGTSGDDRSSTSRATTPKTTTPRTTTTKRTTTPKTATHRTGTSGGGNLARTTTSKSTSESSTSNRTSKSAASVDTAGSGTADDAGTASEPRTASTGTANRTTSRASGVESRTSDSGTSRDDGTAMVMEMDAFDAGEFDAAPGVRRFSGSDWKSLREERVLTVMNEPGPGTDPSCYPRDMLPLAQSGKLTKDQTSCVQKSLSKAEYAADQARLSLVLIANAHARQEADNWAWLVQRHLEVIDDENPGLAYRYALHNYEAGVGSYPEALRWANVALAQRAAWTGDVYHERVTRLYKLRAAVSQALWKQAEDEWASGQTEEAKDSVLDWRETTRKAAVEWYRYAVETGMDTKTPYNLCVNASIQEGCEGIDGPPS